MAGRAGFVTSTRSMRTSDKTHAMGLDEGHMIANSNVERQFRVTESGCQHDLDKTSPGVPGARRQRRRSIAIGGVGANQSYWEEVGPGKYCPPLINTHIDGQYRFLH